jgi:putative FmdB family regulatory protein
MPIYEYECLDCGKQCEVMQKFNDKPLSKCPSCGGHMHKLISHTSFVLKGSGWYVTDYASPERKKVLESEAKTGANAGKSDSSSTPPKATETVPKN